MEKTDFEPLQLIRLNQIVLNILEHLNQDNSVNTKLKFDTAPANERQNLCLKELKKSQKRFFNFGLEYRATIQEFIRHFISSYKISVLNNPGDEHCYLNLSKELGINWVRDFIKEFVYSMNDENDQLQYFNFDFENIDTEELDDNEWDWYLNLDEHVPLPQFKKLVKCLHEIEYFQDTWDAYHSFLKDANTNIDFIQERAARGKRTLDKQQLITPLTDKQRKLLFDLLVKNEFIPHDTDKDGFVQAFGNNKNNFTVRWNQSKSKSLLSYFVDVFNCEILGNDGEKSRTQWKPFETLFGVRGLRGAKNDYLKTGSLPLGHKQIDAIINAVLNCK